MKQTKRNRQSPPGSLLEVEHEREKGPLSPSHPHSGKAFDLPRWPNRGQIPDQRGHGDMAKPRGSLKTWVNSGKRQSSPPLRRLFCRARSSTRRV